MLQLYGISGDIHPSCHRILHPITVSIMTKFIPYKYEIQKPIIHLLRPNWIGLGIYILSPGL